MMLVNKNIKIKNLIISALAVVLSSQFICAQESGIVLEDGSQSILAPEQFSNYILKDENDLFSIKLTDSDAKSSLHRLAKEADVNIVIPEDLESRININLNKVNFDLALKAILKSTPYRHTVDDGIYFIEIASGKHIESEQLFSERFPVINANIDDVFAAISSSYGGSGGATTGAASAGDTSAGAAGESVTAGGNGRVNIILDKSNSAIIAQGSQEELTQIAELIGLLDYGPEQVAIEATFVEINVGDSSATGIDWAEFQTYAASLNFEWSGLFGRSAALNIGAGDTAANTAILSSAGNELLLQFVQSTNDGKIVSNPRVITGSSITAEMVVATEFPIPQFDISNADDGSTAIRISGFEFEEIGVLLSVTPTVNADRSITLEIEPELSSQISESFIVPGFGIPVISTSRINTTVTISNGETIAMGGLIQTEETDTIRKVPVLSNLPGIGKIFQHSTKSFERRNLMIFVTARLISAKGNLGDSISDKELRELGMNKNEILPYNKRGKANVNSTNNTEDNQETLIQGAEEGVKAKDASGVRSTSF